MISFTGCKSGNKTTEDSSLKDMVKENKLVDDVYYEIVAEYTKPNKAKTTGKIWMKGEVIKQELDISGNKMTVLLDGDKNECISYIPSQKAANKSELNENIKSQNNPFGLIESLTDDEMKKFKKEKNVKVDEKECYVFSGNVEPNEGFKQQNLGDIKYKVFFQEENQMFVKLEIYSKDELITSIAISNIKEGVKDEDVEFKLPKNVKVNESTNTNNGNDGNDVTDESKDAKNNKDDKDNKDSKDNKDDKNVKDKE
jgi:outer membrane lipoprotein-sorting protein